MNYFLHVSQTTAQPRRVFSCNHTQKADTRASEAIIQIELPKHKQPWNSFAALVDSRPQQCVRPWRPTLAGGEGTVVIGSVGHSD